VRPVDLAHVVSNLPQTFNLTLHRNLNLAEQLNFLRRVQAIMLMAGLAWNTYPISR
jgi:hypothetical protein